MSNPLISIESLSFQYEKSPILQDVNVSIESGEFIGIFGPNGGGKTTLLKLLLGMLSPQSGRILINGRSPKEFSKRMGYVPQLTRFDKDFPISVMEVVLMGCLSTLKWWGGYPKEAKRKTLEALDAVGISHLAHQSFGTLSGGQAQRALIARAIVNEPELLILDEPTASVDLQAEAAIYKLLQELNKDMTIVMVTHDLQTIIDKAQRLICVQRHVTCLKAKEVCEHFALGLYHSPLTSKDHFKFP